MSKVLGVTYSIYGYRMNCHNRNREMNEIRVAEKWNEMKDYEKKNRYRCYQITTINYCDRPDLIFIFSNYTLIRITIYKVILPFD